VAVKTVTVLGATGSVGAHTLALLRAGRDRFAVRALVGGRKAEALARAAHELGAEVAVIADPAAWPALRDALAGSGIRAEAGSDAVVAAAALPADWTMAAITGAAGLMPTLAAIRRGGTIALANKESLVCAGEVMLDAVTRAGATLLPADSEHSAIFQVLERRNIDAVDHIFITASGGPFRTFSRAQMAHVTPEQALKHPVWAMGAKISIDSATLMNKGLELIEAARLFPLRPDQFRVLVHPQSVVHGLVQYRDGSMLAHLGPPDMRVPIAHTLAWPDRMPTDTKRLDLAELGALTFETPDPQRFPALALAREALLAGGGAPTILNAANEVAVSAFLARRIGFLDIARLVSDVLMQMGTPPADSLDAVLALDAAARETAEQMMACAA